MDQLREEYHQRDWAEPDQDPPPILGQPERRMQARAYNYWTALLRGRSLPAIGDCDSGRVRDFEDNSLLLDVTSGAADPAICSLGAKLAEQCDVAAPIAHLSEVPDGSLLSAIAGYIGRTLDSRAPFGFASEFVNQRGATILYRGILLPFSNDGQAIDYVLCAVNWKEVADPELAEALHREIDRALSREPLRVLGDGPLTEWADGPAARPDADEWAGIDRLPAAPGLAGVPGAGDDPAELLAAARGLAEAARAAEHRAHELRAAAIGLAFDLSLVAAPGERECPEHTGAPPCMSASLHDIAALVFGAPTGVTLGGTRPSRAALAGYAEALAHGHRLGLARGAFAGLLAQAPGGLRGVIAAERRMRRGESPSPM